MTLVGYQVPKRQQVAIVIDVSDQVNEADQGGGIATLADTISEGLKEHGIDNQLYASKYDHPKPPRVDVFVSYWHGTPGSAHGTQAIAAITPLAGPFAMAAAYNNIVLDCKVTLPGQDKPVFSRHFERTGFGGGSTTNDDNAAAESAGNAIVDAILKR
ncbi:MAG TPA: hypothetical protein VGJ91_21005 [Polyangiaceae bacterium]